jgi:Acyclic terpene utilisation family protein AtuA
MKRPVRIANCSGFYGDRLSAAREMVEGGPIDVLTGDYLAELTMLILWKAQQKNPTAGYATTFLRQMEEVMGTCLDRGIRVVTNAGGLNPSGLAAQLGVLAGRLGLAPKISYLEGDDLVERIDALVAGGQEFRHLDTGISLTEAGIRPLSANAYLGGWGIAQALQAGADVVVCPRVTDASLVVGPAAWWHGWETNDYHQIAGAVAAGHIIECGPQATGGNYAWLEEITDRRLPGFPIAEVDADGSSVITKHPGTGGLVSPGTVTAQLLYEIAQPQYANPDVVAHFDTVHLETVGPDRVRVSGTRGSPPPDTTKVAMNYLGGYRNTMTLILTGLDIEEKAAWAEEEVFAVLGGKERFDDVDVRLLRFDQPDAPTNEQATAHLRITVKDTDVAKVGRKFSNAIMQLALAGYAGFHTTTPPTDASSYGVYWPTLVPSDLVEQVVVLPTAARRIVTAGPRGESTDVAFDGTEDGVRSGDTPPVKLSGPTVRGPLGRVCGARSGDKGGNANVGLWTRDADTFAWLQDYLTVDRLKTIVPEAAVLAVERYPLPNLFALNFVIVGLLEEGVAASTRPDPQAKGLGEYIRSRYVDIPAGLLRQEQE